MATSSKTRQRKSTANKTSGRPGRSGICEAQLWEFTGPSKFVEEDEIPIERVAAGSLEEALTFIRRRRPGFIIVRAEATGVVAVLSCSPLD